MNISKKAMSVPLSTTLAITAKAKKLKAEGKDLVAFGAGEPDFNTPDYIIEAAKNAMEQGLTKYTPSGGTLQLKNAIAQKFLQNGLTYTPKQIVVSNGAKHSIYNALLAMLNEGEEVIIPAPYWLSYPEMVKLCGGVPVCVQTDAQSYKLTPQQLQQAITPKTKALILNSPNNPSGAVYTKSELIALARVIESAKIFVISDEVYENLVYDGQHYSIAAVYPAIYDQTVTVNALSKSYSMTGWRVGYLGACQKLAEAIDNLQSHTTSNANSIAQFAAATALSGGEQFVQEMHKTFSQRANLMVKLLKDIPHIEFLPPQGAFYVLCDISAYFGKKSGNTIINSAQTFAEVLLEKALVAVIPCEAFGADNCIRLSYCIDLPEISKGIERVGDFLLSLK